MRKQIYAINKENAISEIAIISNIYNDSKFIPPKIYTKDIIYQRSENEKLNYYKFVAIMNAWNVEKDF